MTGRILSIVWQGMITLGVLFLSGCAHEVMQPNDNLRWLATEYNLAHAGLQSCRKPMRSVRTTTLPAKPRQLSMAWISDTVYKFATSSKNEKAVEQRQLEALGDFRTAADDFKLSFLILSHVNPDPDQTAVAYELLRDLPSQTNDLASRRIFRMMERLDEKTSEVIQLRAELAQSAQQVIDLKTKIAQINRLEVDLQQRGEQKDRGRGSDEK